MSDPAVWLHIDSLSPTDPALLANPDAPAIFVFDEPFLREAQLSFKRLLFVYECAQEALAGRVGDIRRGEMVAELLDFCMRHGCDEIHVTATASPRFNLHITHLGQQLLVVEHQVAPFLTWNGAAPRRFSRFWKQVENEALRPTGEGPPELQEPPDRKQK
jgi:hypothetical protein